MADDAAPPELDEKQQAKLAAKQFKAESRKLAKALKGKKPEPKLEAIQRCGEEHAFVAGECLVPLLQSCVFKRTKKGDNGDVVAAALSCARAFLETVVEVEEGAPPQPPRCTLVFDACEKKKNKLSGGKLFSDLLAHETSGIVVDAAASLRTLLAVAFAAEAPKAYAKISASGDPVGALVNLVRNVTPGGAPAGDAATAEEPTEEPAAEPAAWSEEDTGLGAALEALSSLLSNDEDAADRFMEAGGCDALVGVACSDGAPAELASAALALLDAATSKPGGADALLDAPGAAERVLAHLQDAELGRRLLVVERLLEAQGRRGDSASQAAGVEPDEDADAAAAPAAEDDADAAPADVPCAFDGPGVAAALAAAFAAAEGDAVAVAARCLGRAVAAFGATARTPLLQTSAAAVLAAIAAAAPGSAARRCCEKALHVLLRSGPFALEMCDVDAAALAAALSTDVDAQARAIRVIDAVVHASPDDVAPLADACLAPLISAVQQWADAPAKDPQLSPRGVEEPDAPPVERGAIFAEADAAHAALTALRALGAASPDALRTISNDARGALDAALARGPRTPDEFRPATPVSDAAAPAPAEEAPAEGAPREAVVCVLDPLERAWDDASYAGVDVAVRASVMALLTQLARSAAPPPPPPQADDEEAAEPAEIEPAEPAGEVSTPAACGLLLDILCVDLVRDGDTPYWGQAAADEDELVREDMRAEALDLLAAVGADEAGRHLLLAAAQAWTPAGVAVPVQETVEEAEDAVEQFAAPEDLEDAKWWPYVRPLAPAVCVIADPTATAFQHKAAVEMVRALCSDPSQPKDDQSLTCDRFAAVACAMGVLVPLCALASEQTAISVARFCVAEDDFDPTADFASTAASAALAVEDLAGRAYQREGRIATYADDAFDAQFAVAMAEKSVEFEAQMQAFEEAQATLREEYDARVAEAGAWPAEDDEAEAEAPAPGVEPLACAPAPAFDDRAARRAATEAADAARHRVVDARGGPTNSQWARHCLDAKAPDLRRQTAASTALLAACSGSGAARTCSALVAKCGGDASVPDANGRTPSMAALLRGSTATVHSLLEAGCDADVRSEEGTNVLMCAFVAPDGDELDAALEHAKKEWEVTGTCPATVLTGSGSYVEAVLQFGGDPDVADGRGKFPLHWCVEGCAVTYAVDGLFPCSFTLREDAGLDMLQLLLNHGASPDVADRQNSTALHAACRRSNSPAARILLEAGAQMNLADAVGRLPLHLACYAASDLGLVEELLASGATKPRGVAKHNDSRAGLSKHDKTRRNVVSAMDRALQAALTPACVKDVLPSTAELAASSDAAGRSILHCAAGAAYDFDDDVWAAPAAVTSAGRGVFLAQLAARDDVDGEQLHAVEESGRDAVCLAIKTLGDASLPFVEAAVAKGYDVERESELPDEDLDLPYRPAWETPDQAPPGYAGDADADLFDDLEEPASAAPSEDGGGPSENGEEPGAAMVDALEAYLKQIFDRVDSDGSGSISVQEAIDALREDDEFAEVLGVDGRSKEDVLEAMAAIDADGDSRVSWREFRAAALGEEPEEEAPDVPAEDGADIEAYLRAIFDRNDRDGSGEISTKEAIEAVQTDEEFAEMLGFEGATKIERGDGTRSQLEYAIDMLDADGNGKLNWGEFREAFLGPLTEESEDPFEEYLNEYEAYLETVFDRVDKNKDGTLSYAELVAGLKDPDFAEESGFYDSGMSRGEFAAEFCDALDWDNDKTVDWFEFRDEAMGKALDAMHEARMEKSLREVFERVDESGDGAITIVEAVKALRNDEDFADVLGFWSTHKANKSDGSMDYLAEQIQAMDINGDGVISWDEFRGCVLGLEPEEESVVQEERAVGAWLEATEDVSTTKARLCGALHMAACSGAQGVLQCLVEHGAPAYGGRPNPIALAALKGASPEACAVLEAALPGGGRAPDSDLGDEAPAQAAAARGFAATALALGAKGLQDPRGRTCALIAARRGKAGCVEALLEAGCAADGAATPSLLEGAIDAVDCDVVKVAVRHVPVSVNDVLRAEAVHAFWAEKLMAIPRDARRTSTAETASELSAAAFHLVADACSLAIDEDAHLHHCFAEGRCLIDELLARETARLNAEERARAATSIQKQARGRNRRSAMRDMAEGKRKSKDKKGKKKKKGKK